ncbi:MAG TPA: MarR family transcriptional regulator [Edaphobacter sp.]|nr:MarR family transcriptional regulator [Edaphobacter sp.]
MQRDDQKTNRPGDSSGIHLWLVLWKAAQALEAHSNRSIRRFGMGQSDFGVLEALLHRGPMSVKALGSKVLLTSGSMTAAVDRLATRGLVTRQDAEGDRRSRIVHLTDAGRELIEKVFAEHSAAMEEAVAGFPAEERLALIDALRKLGRNAEDKLTQK